MDRRLEWSHCPAFDWLRPVLSSGELHFLGSVQHCSVASFCWQGWCSRPCSDSSAKGFFLQQMHAQEGWQQRNEQEGVQIFRNYLCPCGTLLEVPSLFLPFSAFEQRRPSQPDVGMNQPVLFYGKKKQSQWRKSAPRSTGMHIHEGSCRCC